MFGSKSRHPAFRVLALVALLIAAPFAIVAFHSLYASRSFYAALEDLRDEGDPTNENELVSFLHLEEAVLTASVAICRSLEQLQAFRDTHGSEFKAVAELSTSFFPAHIGADGRPDTKFIPSAASLERADRFLSEVEKPLAELRKSLADRSGGRRRRPLFAPSNKELKSLHQWLNSLPKWNEKVGTAARLLQLRSAFAMRKQDRTDFAQSIVDQLKLARVLDHEAEPSMQLLRHSIGMAAVQQIELGLRSTSFSDDQLLEFQVQLRAVDGGKSLLRTRLADRALQLISFSEKLSNAANDRAWWNLPATLRATKTVSAMTKYVNSTKSSVAAFRGSPGEGIKRVRAIESRRREWKEAVADDNRQLFGSDEQCLLSGAEFSAGLRIADNAIAVLRFEKGSGAFPTQLHELVKEYLPFVGRDPFDDRPLRYLKLKNGFKIYSVGSNFRDDNGTLTNKIDLGFSVRSNAAPDDESSPAVN